MHNDHDAASLLAEIQKLQQLGPVQSWNGHRPSAELLLETWLDFDSSEENPELDAAGHWLWDELHPLDTEVFQAESDPYYWNKIDGPGWCDLTERWLLEHWGELEQDVAFQLDLQFEFLDPTTLTDAQKAVASELHHQLRYHVDPEGVLARGALNGLLQSRGLEPLPDKPDAVRMPTLEEFKQYLEYVRLAGGHYTLPRMLQEGKEPYQFTLEEAIGYLRAGKPADPLKFLKDWRQETEAIRHIKALMDRLYAMEKVGVAGKERWAERQYKRSQLGGYRIRHEEIDRQMMLMVAAEWGLSIGDGERTERQGRSLRGALRPGEEQLAQQPGFTLVGRDCLLAGSGGAGKTMAALALSYGTATGQPNLFDVEDGVAPSQRGATLWIGTDGGDGAYPMVRKYSEMLKVPSPEAWAKRFTFWGADKASGDTPWAFNVKGLHQLFAELERGHESGPYRMVVIDSLKAVMDLGGLDFGIGPMGTCMRLMQAAATRFGVAVVWIHHLKPGAGKGDMGIDATGGNSNINQIPFCVHTLHKVQIKGYQHVVRWNAEKYRGEPSRAFNYTLDRDGGLFEIVQGALEEDRTSEILEQLWIQRDCGVGITELVDAVDAAKKTIQNKLTQLAKDGKVANVKRRWCITPAGAEILGNEQPELNPAINEWLLSLK